MAIDIYFSEDVRPLVMRERLAKDRSLSRQGEKLQKQLSQ